MKAVLLTGPRKLISWDEIRKKMPKKILVFTPLPTTLTMLALSSPLSFTSSFHNLIPRLKLTSADSYGEILSKSSNSKDPLNPLRMTGVAQVKNISDKNPASSIAGLEGFLKKKQNQSFLFNISVQPTLYKLVLTL